MENQGLKDGQEVALSLCFISSATLSIIGSSTIVWKVVANRKRATAYDRLMLGLSLSDIVASISHWLTPLFLPTETSSRPFAIGNDGTCTFLGFLTQLGFAPVLYNGFLSFYYLLTIRFGVKKHNFARRYEPWMHIITITFSFVTATVGAGMGFYSEVQVGLGCWVNNWPIGCTEENCLSEELGWIYGSTPIIFALLSLITNNILVYLHVRRVFRESNDAVDTERKEVQRMQTRELATQGTLYIVAFLFCWWSPVTVRIIETFSPVAQENELESGMFGLLVCYSAFWPLQGFLNMLIYNRPNYRRVRKAFPELSRLSAIRIACFDTNIPKLQEITRTTTMNRMKKNSLSSGANFQSNLDSIKEVSEESDDSSHEEGTRPRDHSISTTEEEEKISTHQGSREVASKNAAKNRSCNNFLAEDLEIQSFLQANHIPLVDHPKQRSIVLQNGSTFTKRQDNQIDPFLKSCIPRSSMSSTTGIEHDSPHRQMPIANNDELAVASSNKPEHFPNARMVVMDGSIRSSSHTAIQEDES